MLGHSEGTNDVASVVTDLIVPNLPCAYEWRPFPLTPVSSRLEYVVMSVMLLLDASGLQGRAQSPEASATEPSMPEPGRALIPGSGGPRAQLEKLIARGRA